MIAIPNIPKPKEAVNVEVIFRDSEGYVVGHKLDCPLIDIVRCKDCKYVMMLRSESSAKEFGQIYECRKGVFNCPKPNDFCSRGERRSE